MRPYSLFNDFSNRATLQSRQTRALYIDGSAAGFLEEVSLDYSSFFYRFKPIDCAATHNARAHTAGTTKLRRMRPSLQQL